MYSDNRVDVQIYACTRKNCSWSETFSVKKMLLGNIHTDLVQTQAELGSRNSYRRAARDMSALVGDDRRIINKTRIHTTTNKIGKILENKNVTASTQALSLKKIIPAKELNVAIDGGHVHDSEHRGRNFEVMIAKAFQPESVVRIDEHHTAIIKKHTAASAKNDAQETMKSNVIEAVTKEGADRNVTTITVLADGAKNCWNIALALTDYCLTLFFILDWFHIGKYIQNLKSQLPAHKDTLDSIKEKLWIGDANLALLLIRQCKESLQDEDQREKLENFLHYINDNKTHVVNYQERKDSGLLYTSHIAESSVEHMLNERAKRKQKMQWSRNGLHAVMQIRSSIVSDEWENDWENIIVPALKFAA